MYVYGVWGTLRTTGEFIGLPSTLLLAQVMMYETSIPSQSQLA